MLSKREQAQNERRLTAALTRACEAAKAELVGFVWLTHRVDYQNLRGSLRVTWVFDTEANRELALAGGQQQLMADLTAEAFSEAGIVANPVSNHLAFDSEEQCQRIDAGDWEQRLARKGKAGR